MFVVTFKLLLYWLHHIICRRSILGLSILRLYVVLRIFLWLHLIFIFYHFNNRLEESKYKIHESSSFQLHAICEWLDAIYHNVMIMFSTIASCFLFYNFLHLTQIASSTILTLISPPASAQVIDLWFSLDSFLAKYDDIFILGFYQVNWQEFKKFPWRGSFATTVMAP